MKRNWYPVSEEELGEMLRRTAEVEADMTFTEAGVINGPNCGYCGMVICPDPTDPEDWVHLESQDAQCIVDDVKLDAYAIPVRTTSA